MNRILIEIICAATSKNYDFWIPSKMNILQVIDRIATEITQFELNETLLGKKDDLVLYSYEQSVFLNDEQTMSEAGIKSGDRLLLI